MARCANAGCTNGDRAVMTAHPIPGAPFIDATETEARIITGLVPPPARLTSLLS